MIETIAEINKRYVWRPPLAAYSAPHAQVIDPIQVALNQGILIGWNLRTAHYKELGKI